MIIPNIWENKKCSKPPTSYDNLILSITCYWFVPHQIHQQDIPWRSSPLVKIRTSGLAPSTAVCAGISTSQTRSSTGVNKLREKSLEEQSSLDWPRKIRTFQYFHSGFQVEKCHWKRQKHLLQISFPSAKCRKKMWILVRFLSKGKTSAIKVWFLSHLGLPIPRQSDNRTIWIDWSRPSTVDTKIQETMALTPEKVASLDPLLGTNFDIDHWQVEAVETSVSITRYALMD